ncbi:MAG: 50S ribosomal protein L4 [Euryarchaeota archaeon]|nr:50S ribosomal protein L4 [Euryarchaeota archaeon]
MKVNVYSLEGKVAGKIELPKVFKEEIRPDLIKRAVLAAQSARYQRHGVDWFAGKRTSAFSWGPGHGVSRVPRVKGSRHPAAGRGAMVPQAVGGREAHPPVVQKKVIEKINVKERRKAIASAIAATAVKELVQKRGHIIANVPQIPLIVEDELESIKTAKGTKEALEKLGIWEDIVRAKQRNIRAGKGKMRGRKYKNRKSVLLIVAEDKGIKLGARNHPGIDVVRVENLGIEHVAPGTHYGRLTVYTKAAVQKLGARFK